MRRPDHLSQAGRWTSEHIHEGSDQDTRRVFWVGMALAVMAGISGVITMIIMNIMGQPVYNSRPPAPLQLPEPHLEAYPYADIAAQHLQQQLLLDGYSWIDRKHGIVHIPIGLAMDKLARTPMGLVSRGKEKGHDLDPTR